jgi:ABC-type Mn2+/Zn2+ transport system permease subunit
MFDSPAFDVAIGLVFLYVVLALVCSTVNEAIATAVGLRARYLETGLLNLLSGAVSKRLPESRRRRGSTRIRSSRA